MVCVWHVWEGCVVYMHTCMYVCVCGIHVPVCVFIHVCAHSLVQYSLQGGYLVLRFAAAKQGLTQSGNPGLESELHPG